MNGKNVIKFVVLVILLAIAAAGLLLGLFDAIGQPILH